MTTELMSTFISLAYAFFTALCANFASEKPPPNLTKIVVFDPVCSWTFSSSASMQIGNSENFPNAHLKVWARILRFCAHLIVELPHFSPCFSGPQVDKILNSDWSTGGAVRQSLGLHLGRLPWNSPFWHVKVPRTHKICDERICFQTKFG